MKKIVLLIFLALALSVTLISCAGAAAPETGGDDVCTHHNFVLDEQMTAEHQPTCNHDGAEYYVCTNANCYDVGYTIPLPAVDCDFILVESEDPTCYSTGFKRYECRWCNVIKYEYIDALAHNYIVSSYESPSCYNAGHIEKTCTKCGDTDESSLSPFYTHDYRTQEAQDPTCTEYGWEEYELCIRCGDNNKGSHLINPTSHVMSDEWTIDTQPTADSAGSRSHHCTREGCDYKENVTEVPRIGYTDHLTYSVSSNYATVTGIESDYISEITIVSIPETYQGLPVAYIARNAFAYNSNIAVVKIPNTVVNVYVSAFMNCSNLTTVEFAQQDSKLWHIDQQAFANCFKLAYINLPEGLQQIDKQAFYGCAFEDLVIPDSVSMVCRGAFEQCKKIKSLKLPRLYDEATDIYSNTYFLGFIFGATTNDSTSYIPTTLETLEFTKLTALDYQTLKGCWTVKHLYLPDTLTSIVSNAFDSCESLEYNTLDGVNYIGSRTNPYLVIFRAIDKTKTTYNLGDAIYMMPGAFEDCTALTNITLPDTLKEISQHAFRGCTALEYFPTCSNITAISNNAFNGCTQMQGTIPESVEIIGQYAFLNCASLDSVVISSNVTIIGSGAFHGAGGGSLSFTIQFEQTSGWKNILTNSPYNPELLSNTMRITDLLTDPSQSYPMSR